MNLTELIESLGNKGLRIRRRGERLFILGDQSKLTDSIKRAIVAHKPALLKVAKEASDEDEERQAIENEHNVTDKELRSAIAEWQAIVDGWWREGAEGFPPACPKCRVIDVAVDDAGRVRCGKCAPGKTAEAVSRRQRIIQQERNRHEACR